MAEMDEVITALQELLEDSNVPKNVKSKVQSTMDTLNKKGDNSMKISRALHELEEVGEDTNLDGITRTQILGVISMLSSLES